MTATDDRFDWEALKAQRRRGDGPRLRAVLALPGRRGRAGRRRPVVTGCNVENAAYGVTLCAECGLVSQLHLTGGGRLTHFVCVDGRGDGDHAVRPLPPAVVGERRRGPAAVDRSPASGRCEVLPDAFGPEDLGRGRPGRRT